MARKWVEAARQKVLGMEPWWINVNRNPSKKPSMDGRTHEEQLWDSGVFAASELVRRLTGDNDLSAAIHELCHWRRREHESGASHELKIDNKARARSPRK